MNSEFLPWSKGQHQAKPRTHKRYRVAAKPLIRAFGKLHLNAISPGLVENFKLARLEEISPAGVNRDLAAIRFMLNYAIRQDHIVRNPVIGVRFLPEGPGRMRIVSHDEERRYLEAANPLLRDVAILMVETGLCPEEVFTIRRENVHLKLGYLFIPSGKTNFRRRNVPLTDRSIRVLKRRLSGREGPFLFPGRIDPSKH